MPEKYNSLIDGRKNVISAGVREQLVSGEGSACRKVIIMADLTNPSGHIVVGGDSVVALSASVAASGKTRRGIPLAPGQSITLYVHNLNKVWLDAEYGGEGVTYVIQD